MSRGAFLDAWPNQIPYRDTQEPDESDLLQLLIPHMHRQSRAAKWQYVDPKLWLTLIRIFWADTLPQTFRKYPLPLADPYLPYIQQIDPTPDFSLIVVLDLRKRKELTDETIISLKALHQLAVLEMASTTVSNAGIAKLAEALRVDEEDGFSRGPWRLRCLGLANTRVDTMVEPSLRAFPLLSVVDLRDTRCDAPPVIHGWQQHDMLESDQHTDLFDPAPPDSRMHYLGNIARKYDRNLLPSSQPPYIIHVQTLYHPPPPKYREHGGDSSPFSEDNGYFVLSETGSSTRGNLEQIEKRRKAIQARNSVFLYRQVGEDRSQGGEAGSLMPFRFNFNGLLMSPHGEPVTDAEILHETRIEAYNEYAATLKRAEAERARRMNSEEIERGRDPDRLSSRERLNRTLVLVRIPPSYEELDGAVGKKVEARKRLAAIKEAARAGSSDPKKRAANPGEIGMVDKRRKLGQGKIWGDILSSAKSSGSTLQRRTSLSGASSSPSSSSTLKPPQSRNPFAKGLKEDLKNKILRQ